MDAGTTEKVRMGVGLDLTAGAGTGADPDPRAGVDMRAAVVQAGERAMVVGLSRHKHKVGLAGGAKPLRAGLAGRVKPPRATPMDRDPGGVGRACVKAPNPSNLSTSPSPGRCQRGALQGGPPTQRGPKRDLNQYGERDVHAPSSRLSKKRAPKSR